MSQHAIALTLCLLVAMGVTFFAFWLPLWMEKQTDKLHKERNQ